MISLGFSGNLWGLYEFDSILQSSNPLPQQPRCPDVIILPTPFPGKINSQGFGEGGKNHMAGYERRTCL